MKLYTKLFHVRTNLKSGKKSCDSQKDCPPGNTCVLYKMRPEVGAFCFKNDLASYGIEIGDMEEI